MDQFERIIKLALKEDVKGLRLEKTAACPEASELVNYLTGSLPRKRRSYIESHLADCLSCLEDLLLAEKASSRETKKGPSGKAPFKNWLKKNVWLILAITSFALSFIYSRYFLQFLIATLVLAAKWIFETVNARILITIYEAWKTGGEKEVSRVLERYNPRNP